MRLPVIQSGTLCAATGDFFGSLSSAVIWELVQGFRSQTDIGLRELKTFGAELNFLCGWIIRIGSVSGTRTGSKQAALRSSSIC